MTCETVLVPLPREAWKSCLTMSLIPVSACCYGRAVSTWPSCCPTPAWSKLWACGSPFSAWASALLHLQSLCRKETDNHSLFPLVFKSLHWTRKKIGEIRTLYSSQNELIRHRFNKMYSRSVHLISLTWWRGLYCTAACVTILNHNVCAPLRLGGVAGGDQSDGEPELSVHPLPEAVIQWYSSYGITCKGAFWNGQ